MSATGDLAGLVHDLGQPRVPVLLLDLPELVLDDLQHQPLARQDLAEARDVLQDVPVFLEDLFALQPGQPLQTHVQDRLGLDVREREGRRQPRARLGRRRRAPDQRHHLVEVVESDLEPFQDVGPGLGLGQVVARAPHDDLLAVQDEVLQNLLEVQQLGAVVDDGEEDDPEGGLHPRVLEQLVGDHLGHGLLLEAEGDAHALAVGLVAHVADAVDLLVPDQLGDLLDQLGLVDLVGQLGDDQGFGLGALVLLDRHPRPHPDDAAAGGEGLPDARPAVDDPAGREIGAGDEAHELLAGGLRAVDQHLQRLHHFAQVVRGDVGRHADGDAGRPVDEQVGDLGRQHRGLGEGLVVVRGEVDRLLFEVREHLVSQALHPDLGVPHGRRRVAVDRPEVPLPVDQGIAHGEPLRHAHDRVVHGRVPVRVIFTDDVADDAGGFLVRFVPVVVQLPHGVEHAAVHRLQPVAHVGQGPPDDHAHGVIEIGLLHLFFDADFRGSVDLVHLHS